MRLQFFFVLVFLVINVTSAAKNVSTLPGYEGPLPFKLETGYVTPKNYENQRIFYYFVESQNDSSRDPILFWVSGGPGYSSLWSFFYELGPLSFNLSYTFDGTLPQLVDSPYAWTKFMNVLFVDAPAGTGFSYATTPEAYYTDHVTFAKALTGFIHQWLSEHESFRSNPLYISGDGFSGNPLPITMDLILQDNKEETIPHVNLTGYLLISPGTDFDLDFNSRYYFANRMGLIEDGIFEEARDNCNGTFLNPTTDACTESVNLMEELVKNLNLGHILQPACHNIFPNIPTSVSTIPLHRSLKENIQLVSDVPDVPDFVPGLVQRCRKYSHQLSIIWANTKSVQDALGVEEGTKLDDHWELYNSTVDNIAYSKGESFSVVGYHKNLTRTDLRGMIVSGDHDMDIPNISVQKWIEGLDLTLVERWRVVTVSNETAGYTKKYENGKFSLTYVLVKGGGHLTPQHRPRECYHVAHNWTLGLAL